MKYREGRGYENLHKAQFPGVGPYDFPRVRPCRYAGGVEFIPWSEALQTRDRKGKGTHFFLDDYRFIRLWNNIDRYIPILQEFEYVMAPDFSLFADYPIALQIYNHYRCNWVCAYMQDHNINVIPVPNWSTRESFEWCFDGDPVGGAVALSAVGTQQNRISKEAFMEGYDEMLRRLRPDTIIFYGKAPDGCEGNIIEIGQYSDRFKRMRIAPIPGSATASGE